MNRSRGRSEGQSPREAANPTPRVLCVSQPRAVGDQVCGRAAMGSHKPKRSGEGGRGPLGTSPSLPTHGWAD